MQSSAEDPLLQKREKKEKKKNNKTIHKSFFLSTIYMHIEKKIMCIEIQLKQKNKNLDDALRLVFDVYGHQHSADDL